MPNVTVTETTYEVWSGREGLHTTLAEATFPEGTFDLWGDESPAMGRMVNAFGNVLLGVLAERWREKLDETGDGSPVTMTEADAYTAAARASERVQVWESIVREGGADDFIPAPPSYALEVKYLPLVGGTTYRG
jgi:hypothetical protein